MHGRITTVDARLATTIEGHHEPAIRQPLLVKLAGDVRPGIKGQVAVRDAALKATGREHAGNLNAGLIWARVSDELSRRCSVPILLILQDLLLRLLRLWLVKEAPHKEKDLL